MLVCVTDFVNRTPREDEVKSFYHLTSIDISSSLCQGLACFVARHLNPERWEMATRQPCRIYCLGKCYLAPSAGWDTGRPYVGVDAPEAIVLSNIRERGVLDVDDYRRRCGYDALETALESNPGKIVDVVEESGLRGRGGAGFTTGRKWRLVLSQKSDVKYVVVNGDEGDPGAYIDRFIMEEDPHKLVEATIIAGYAVGASEGYIYVRKEYTDAIASLRRAVDEATKHGFLGTNIMGSNFSFNIKLVSGEGSYICGEETALLNSIEGRRPEVRARPPYPTARGLYGRPTLVNNVETLANIPWIILNGGAAYKALGFSNSRGTKVVSLNSLFSRPGLYEVEMGVPLRKIVEELGDGLKSGEMKGLIVGGPLAGIIPLSHLDTPLGFEELRAVGGTLGHGGIVAFDRHTTIPQLIHHVFDFGAYESCGKCTPCRLGSREIEKMFRNSPPSLDRKRWRESISALAMTSLCGHGVGMAELAYSVERYYGGELM